MVGRHGWTKNCLSLFQHCPLEVKYTDWFNTTLDFGNAWQSSALFWSQRQFLLHIFCQCRAPWAVRWAVPPCKSAAQVAYHCRRLCFLRQIIINAFWSRKRATSAQVLSTRVQALHLSWNALPYHIFKTQYYKKCHLSEPYSKAA